MKKILATVLSLLMVVTVMVPVTATVEEDEVFTILAASDFQTKGDSLSAGGSYDVNDASEDGAAIVSDLMAQVTASHSQIDALLFGGDYSHGSNNASYTKTGYEYLNDALLAGGLPATAEQFCITGNHENGLQYNAQCSFLNQTGGYDREQFGVFCINHDDYPYNAFLENAKSITESTAQALEEWLATQEVGKKPIFVMSHLPLHYSTRTRTRNQGVYAQYLVDVLNKAGERGLNIIFLYGHNHAGGYDTYIGGSTNFATVGDDLWVATPDEPTAEPTRQTLQFTYMNYGYLGYYEPTTADNEFTMTVFEVRGDDVTIRRYGRNGEHGLQAKEGRFWVSDVHDDSVYGYQPDTKAEPSGLTVYGNLLYGDVDESGEIAATDALMVLKAVVGKTALNDKQTKTADVDGNGAIAATDALFILKHVVGKIQKFPVME